MTFVPVPKVAAKTPAKLRRPRRLGGQGSSHYEREPAMKKFRDAPGEVKTFGWRSQCFCGSTTFKFYRRAWWCIGSTGQTGCGREFIQLPGRDYERSAADLCRDKRVT